METKEEIEAELMSRDISPFRLMGGGNTATSSRDVIGRWTKKWKKKSTIDVGPIFLVIGPMFTGKSTLLTNRASHFKSIGTPPLIIKQIKDTQYQVDQSTEITSHDSLQSPAVPASSILSCSETYWDRYEEAHHIIVDEAHMFTPDDLVLFCQTAVDQDPKHLVVGSIDRNTQRDPIFQGVNRLVPLADEVLRFNVECSICGALALFIVRTTPVANDDWIGGAEAYASLCRSHYSRLKISLATEYAPVGHL